MTDETMGQGGDPGGDQQEAPGQQEQAQPEKRSIRPIKDGGKPKPQPFFRQNTPENVEDFYRTDIRTDDRPRDENGRFLPGDGEEQPPKKGVLSEKKDTKPRIRPANAPPAPPQEGEEQEDQPAFVPVRIGKHLFKTQQELETHFNRVTTEQRVNARRVAEMQQVLDSLNQNVGLPTEGQQKLPQPGQEPSKENAEPEITNPFLKSLLEENDDNNKWWEELGKDIGGGKHVLAIGRVIENFENRIKQLVQYIERTQTKTAEPMQAFLGALNNINQTGETFANFARSTDDDGNPRYPEIQSRQDIRELTSLMKEHTIPLTEKGFALAYEVWSSKKSPNPKAGIPQPRYAQPDQGDDEDHAAAAAAASVRNSSGPAVDPRAPQREPTRREWIDDLNKKGKVGLFNRMS